uniref:SCP domain-containing protein n=1 Tax=uncultured bacterium contig00028 TaxID=1181517 RepID=A0A806KJ82_9BACT|nr:hypothetical protein [uncultured bacterium contig00028]
MKTKHFLLAAILTLIAFTFTGCGDILGDVGIFGDSSSSVGANNDSSSSSGNSYSSAGNSPSSSSYTFTAKMNAIRTRYANIQTSFSGGYFITVPSNTLPYAAGKVKNEVLQAGLNATNLARFIAGIPDDVELDDGYTDLCQHGVVLMDANGDVTHSPAKPADMPQAFFDKGYQAASRSNLSSGELPSESVNSYMRDEEDYNYQVVGHRRWILNPKMKKTGFGVGSTGMRMGCMYAFDESRSPAVDYEYIAWPSPGVFPLTFINKNTPWSITVNTQKYGTPNYNNVVVKLKDINRGTTETFSKNTPNQPNTLRTMHFDVNTQGYGIANAIIFRRELSSSFQYSDGDEFEVTVTGLSRPLSYTVKLFSM